MVVLAEPQNSIHRLNWSIQNPTQPFLKPESEKHKLSVGLVLKKEALVSGELAKLSELSKSRKKS
jgi:hypothetical protein